MAKLVGIIGITSDGYPVSARVRLGEEHEGALDTINLHGIDAAAIAHVVGLLLPNDRAPEVEIRLHDDAYTVRLIE